MAKKEPSWYNGYSWGERWSKFEVLMDRIKRGETPQPTGPCRLCNDPKVEVEYHDEDYSERYEWGPTVMFALCRHCHRNKLHMRFSQPRSWEAFLAHVRRGGYASDLTDPEKPEIKREVVVYRAALKRGENATLCALRPYPHIVGKEWFANLRLDKESLKDPKARPRP